MGSALILFGAAQVLQLLTMRREKMRVLAKWAPVANILSKRHDLTPKLARMMIRYYNHEHLLSNRLRGALRTASQISQRTPMKFESETRLSEAINSSFRAIEAFPSSQRDNEFGRLQMEFVLMDQALMHAVHEYNVAVNSFNAQRRALLCRLACFVNGCKPEGYLDLQELESHYELAVS
ncbi:MAG: LemA family protein [Armatimonadetes bacterium]|nr:LemA family protein [Armatimonadota bacterium]